MRIRWSESFACVGFAAAPSEARVGTCDPPKLAINSGGTALYGQLRGRREGETGSIPGVEQDDRRWKQ